MSDLVLSQEVIFEYYNSTDSFPVPFSDIWKWLEYSREDNALTSFLNCGFEENIDYLIFLNFKENSQGRPRKSYRLSSDCFKHFSMMSKTEGGRVVRNYYLECEKRAKQALKTSEIQQKADKAIALLKEIEQTNPVIYQLALQSLGGQNRIQPSENDLNASLVANRLGLAFNKHLKAFEQIQKATSPDAFNDLKEEYFKLAEDYQKLLQLKVSKTQTEYIEVEKEVIKTEYVSNPRNSEERQKLDEEWDAIARIYETAQDCMARIKHIQAMYDWFNSQVIKRKSRNGKLPESLPYWFDVPDFFKDN